MGFKAPFVHFIGEKNGKAITSGTVLHTKNGAYIHNIATLNEQRNKGCARAIMHSIIKNAQEYNHRYAGLVSSQMAASFYTSLGFQEIT